MPAKIKKTKTCKHAFWEKIWRARGVPVIIVSRLYSVKWFMQCLWKIVIAEVFTVNHRHLWRHIPYNRKDNNESILFTKCIDSQILTTELILKQEKEQETGAKLTA